MTNFLAHKRSNIETTAWIGYAIGCPLLGYISDLLGKRKSMMFFSSLCCLTSLLIIVYLPINISLLNLGFILLGLGASGQSIGFAVMAEQCTPSSLAAGLGLIMQ